MRMLIWQSINTSTHFVNGFKPEIRILMGAVDPENLDWDLIRSIHLPHRTATALASRYYYELNKQRQAHLAGLTPSSDEDEGDDAETLYFDPFREWLRTTLTVDIHGAAAVLGSAHSATVRLFTRSHIQAHARAGFNANHDTDTQLLFGCYDAVS